MSKSSERRIRKRHGNLQHLAINDPAGYRSRIGRITESYLKNTTRSLLEGKSQAALEELTKIKSHFDARTAALVRETVEAQLPGEIVYLTLALLEDASCAEPFKALKALREMSAALYEATRLGFLNGQAAKISRAMKIRSQSLGTQGQLWKYETDLISLLANPTNLIRARADEEIFVAANIIATNIEASIPSPHQVGKPRRSARCTGKLHT